MHHAAWLSIASLLATLCLSTAAIGEDLSKRFELLKGFADEFHAMPFHLDVTDSGALAFRFPCPPPNDRINLFLLRLPFLKPELSDKDVVNLRSPGKAEGLTGCLVMHMTDTGNLLAPDFTELELSGTRNGADVRVQLKALDVVSVEHFKPEADATLDIRIDARAKDNPAVNFSLRLSQIIERDPYKCRIEIMYSVDKGRTHVFKGQSYTELLRSHTDLMVGCVIPALSEVGIRIESFEE